MLGANAMGLLRFGGFDGVKEGLLKVGGAAQRAKYEGFQLIVAIHGFELCPDVVE